MATVDETLSNKMNNASLEDDSVQQEQDPSVEIPHPLEYKWIWFYQGKGEKKSKNGAFDSSIQEVTSVTTVQQFWSVYNYLHKASKLSHGSTYSFFKDGIQPVWEDPANSSGGEWHSSADRTPDEWEEDWMNTLLGLIGELYEMGEEIAGARFRVSNNGSRRIELWLRHLEHESLIEVGKKFRDGLANKSSAITYSFHSSKESKTEISITGEKVEKKQK